MTNSECLSNYCPVCGAGIASNVTIVPVEGPIRTERQYRCGRKQHFFYVIKGLEVEEKCGAPKKTKHDSVR